jgi:hypothetical protein
LPACRLPACLTCVAVKGVEGGAKHTTIKFIYSDIFISNFWQTRSKKIDEG